ncbi:MAG: sigma-70 family RNA polymerase sigma factor [Planctomycetota bacterium]
MDRHSIDAAFARFREHGDGQSLALVFDATAPRLLLVAAHVARDAAEAEDLVQTTFLQAIRDAESWDGVRPVGGWLAGILRHRALERRRDARVRGAVPGEGLFEGVEGRERDPFDIVADEEVFELLVGAVDRLPEPYRAVLALRLVHGFDVAHVAHTLARPPKTVRTQLARGLEKLREALPDRSALLGGALAATIVGESARGFTAIRERVLAEAAAGAATGATAVAPAALLGAVSSKLVVGGAALVAALVLLFAWRSDDRRAPRFDPKNTLGGASIAASEAPPDVASASDSPTRTTIDAADSSVSATIGSGTTAFVRGRFVREGGAPVVGARVRLRGAQPATESAADTKIESVTGETGAFAFCVVPDDGAALDLSAEAEAAPSFRRQLHAVSVGDVVDLGDIVLPSCGSIEGRFVRPDGRPAPAEWYADVSWPRAGHDLSDYRVRTTTGAVPGFPSFRIDGAPIGRVTVAFENFDPALDAIADQVVDVRVDDVTRIDVVYRGPDPERVVTIALEAERPWSASADLDPNALTVSTKDGRRLGADDGESTYQGVVFCDVAGGSVDVEVDDPRFEHFSHAGIATGDRFVAELVESVDVGLEVVDATTGAPVASPVVTMRAMVGATGRPNNPSPRRGRTPPAPHGAGSAGVDRRSRRLRDEGPAVHVGFRAALAAARASHSSAPVDPRHAAARRRHAARRRRGRRRADAGAARRRGDDPRARARAVAVERGLERERHDQHGRSVRAHGARRRSLRRRRAGPRRLTARRSTWKRARRVSTSSSRRRRRSSNASTRSSRTWTKRTSRPRSARDVPARRRRVRARRTPPRSGVRARRS